MAYVPTMWKKVTDQSQLRYGAAEIPSLLPEMQTGNPYRLSQPKSLRQQRARRIKIAEPMTTGVFQCHRLLLLFTQLPQHSVWRSQPDAG